MKIIDCFLFYNELTLLEFKLEELYDHIDYFILIESTPEHSSDGKHIGLYPVIKNGGWHFSYFGGIEQIKNKLLNFSNSDFAHIAKYSDETFNEKIKSNKDILNRENIKIDYIKIEENTYLPKNYKMLL